MQIDESNLNLKERREQAGISQTLMAEHLGASQSMISRYENEPDAVPAKVLIKWLQLCGNVAAQKGVSISIPQESDARKELESRLKLIRDYVEVAPSEVGPTDHVSQAVGPDELLSGLEIKGRRPRVAVCGKFDAGKSSLLNAILGGNRLPTGYQPTTTTIALIRHISEKPLWQAESVWMMRKGFDIDRANDKDHCVKHRLVGGGYEALNEFGTRSGAGFSAEFFAAVVYVDAPILRYAEFLDLPGYAHDEADKERADIARKVADVLLYLSPVNGFMDEQDLLYCQVLLKNLGVPSAEEVDANPLCNVYYLATHTHQLNASARGEAIAQASKRSWSHLEQMLRDRMGARSDAVSEDGFRARFFPFSADDTTVRAAFEADLVRLLSVTLPNRDLREVDRHVQLFKKTARSEWDAVLRRMNQALQQREQAQEQYRSIKAVEEERKSRTAKQCERINNQIVLLSRQSKVQIKEVFVDQVTVGAVETMIRKRYPGNKKDALKLALPYLLESVQQAIEHWVSKKSLELGHEIDSMLSEYGPGSRSPSGINDSKDGTWSFDARTAFMGALGGLGTVGALAAWATIAAAGSNLGGYILIAQTVGWMSSIGLGLGSTTSIIGAVSAIGGPLTIAIGLGVLVGAGIWAIFGDSWETRLAKKICSTFEDKKVQKLFEDAIEKYWTDTGNAFEAAMAQTEREFTRQLAALERLAFTTSSGELEKSCQHAQEMRDFFGGIPWKAVS